jgi:hypothetical protein
MNNNEHVWLKGLPASEMQGDRKLNFKENKVQYITLDQLQETVDERNTGQRPINGIVHHDLFGKIQSILSGANLKFELKPIAVTDGGARQYPGVVSLPAFTDQYGEGSLKSLLLRRMIGLFTITDYAVNGYSCGIAVAFHQDGIQVGFGPNIDVCANLCIMGGDMRIQTYGPNKIKVDQMFTIINDWVTKAQEHMARQTKMLDVMKRFDMSYDDVAELVGIMNMIRVGRDITAYKGENEYPLNQSQISRFTTEYLLEYQELKKKGEDTNISLYDLYNLGTNMHKPEYTDLPMIIGNNTAMGQLLIDRYVKDLADKELAEEK